MFTPAFGFRGGRYFCNIPGGRLTAMRWNCLLLTFLLAVWWPAAAWAEGAFGPILRDYPVPCFLAPHQLELSVDYLVMNESVDIFDLRNEELDSVSADLRSTSLGDLEGGRVLVNFGLFATTNLHAEYARRDIEMGVAEFEIDTAELSLRQGVPLPWTAHGLALAFEGGARANRADDLRFTRVRDIDRYVSRIDPDVTVTETASHVIITTGDGTVFSPKAGKPPLNIELEEMGDRTLFLRLLLGAQVGRFTPSAFFEYGHTHIDTRIDSNVAAFIGGSVAGEVAGRFPLDLDRSEDYWKGGAQLSWSVLDEVTLQLAYEYLRLHRESGLDAADDNHIVKADLTWMFIPHMGLNLGGVYYRRQLNGVIPFLYNQFSKTTFDHEYGVLSLGLIGRWGG